MQCEATTKPEIYRNYRDGEQYLYGMIDCENNASVEIDGINLCLKHAGAVAVQKLIGLGMAKKITKNKQSSLCSMEDSAANFFKKQRNKSVKK